MATVLITGGSGLIGRALTQGLLARGDQVRWLSRRAGLVDGVRAFSWDPARGTIDKEALGGIDLIVHLAGSGIADKRWSNSRVKDLIASRAESSRLLLQAAVDAGCHPQCIVSASGVGYYGAVTRDAPFTEDDPPGNDTIARITVAWERAVDEWSVLCRVVKLRTPVVLAKTSGALPRLAAPARWGLAATLGSGKQWMPWVHIEDLVQAYLHALDDESMHGAYNIIGGNCTNRDFTRALAFALHRPLWLPPLPGFLMRIALGEMADLLLNGSPVQSVRLKGAVVNQRPGLESALHDLLLTSSK